MKQISSVSWAFLPSGRHFNPCTPDPLLVDQGLQARRNGGIHHGNRYALCPSLIPLSSLISHDPSEPPYCLFLSGFEHDAGWQLCGALQTVGADFSCHAAGLAAVWHRSHCHAGMGQAPCQRAPAIPSNPLAAVFRVVFWQLSFHALHDYWRGADQRRHRRRDHGGHSCRCGGYELDFFA